MRFQRDFLLFKENRIISLIFYSPSDRLVQSDFSFARVFFILFFPSICLNKDGSFMKTTKWRSLIVLGATLWALYYAAPTAIYFMQPKEVQGDKDSFLEHVPGFLPQEHVQFGLDLSGGLELKLGVDTTNTIETLLGQRAVELTRLSDEKNFGVSSAYVKKGHEQMVVILNEGVDQGEFHQNVKANFSSLIKKGREQNKLFYGYSDEERSNIQKSAMAKAKDVINNRVNAWGVSEASVLQRSDGTIQVQLPGFKDVESAKKLLGRTAQLVFKIVSDDFKGFDAIKGTLPEGLKETSHGSQKAFQSEDKQQLIDFLSQYVPDDKRLIFHSQSIGAGESARLLWTSYVVEAASVFMGTDIKDAVLSGSSDPLNNMPEVTIQMTRTGTKRFSDVTGDNIGKRLAIVLDDVVSSAPVIQSKIPGGQARISLGGGSGFEEAVKEGTELAMILKSGAVPATIEILQQREVGASLGPDLASKGIKGVLFGLALVLCFMLFYYRKPGLIACCALVLNGLFLLAGMANFGFVLTLPGIAGFILTLGMAVDANVLINERIRQEIKDGKNPRKAVQIGFDKVFWTIIDSNITTLIAALVLMETSGPGPIKGFAVTLMLGLIVSLFTALYCSRLFFELALKNVPDEKVKAWLLGGSSSEKKTSSFDFLKFGTPATYAGILLALITLVGVGTKGINYGVEFIGGTQIIVDFDNDVNPETLRQLSSKAEIDSLSVQALDGGNRSFLLRYDENKTNDVLESVASAAASKTFVNFKNALENELSQYGPKIQSVDFIGPQVGKELRNQGILSVFYAILAVLLYIALRFDMRFAPGAIVKMFLDIFLLLGFYVFYGASFDLVAVAAFLTVVGYSVNDTIVIYDRIRENMFDNPRYSLRENINHSLNETLSRTINTSLTTIVSLVGILVFAKGDIWYFAMAMALGVFVATLSSTFIASSFIIWSENWRAKRRVKA